MKGAAVPHRLSTVTMAVRIIVMNAGLAQAIGTHAEFVAADPLFEGLDLPAITAALEQNRQRTPVTERAELADPHVPRGPSPPVMRSGCAPPSSPNPPGWSWREAQEA